MLAKYLDLWGYEVTSTDNGQDGLRMMESEKPGLVILDLSTPPMDGSTVIQVIAGQPVLREIPVLMFIAPDMPEPAGAEYLTKPADLETIKSRIKAIIREKNNFIPIFHSNLSVLSFVSLLQFCETRYLTGEVVIRSGKLHAVLNFKDGDILIQDNDYKLLGQLYDMGEGEITIYSAPVEALSVEQAAPGRPAGDSTGAGLAAGEKPMGRLSGVKINKRLFQLQTEFNSIPEDHISTIVILDGRVVTKRTHSVSEKELTREAVEAIIERQHMEMEREVEEKVSGLMRSKAQEVRDTDEDKFNSLFNQGIERLDAGDLRGAIDAWQEACALRPDDKILQTNIRILNKKLDMAV